MSDHLSPDQLARIAVEPEPQLSPQRRRWLKAELNKLYGMPAEINKPECFDTGHNWND